LRSRLQNLPLLIGPSRKAFIGHLSGETRPKHRDYGTVAACIAALSHKPGCNILRVHNVAAMKQAALVMDAIQNAP